jgi:hypothetical protein
LIKGEYRKENKERESSKEWRRGKAKKKKSYWKGQLLTLINPSWDTKTTECIGGEQRSWGFLGILLCIAHLEKKAIRKILQ